MLFTIGHLLTNGQLFEDPVQSTSSAITIPRQAERLARRIEALGFDVSLTGKAA